MQLSKKAIKVAILDAFRGMEDVDEYVLQPGQLKSIERGHFHAAIDELHAKGIVERLSGHLPLLKLTPKGERLLFSA